MLTVFFSIARHRRLGASMGMVFYESMTVSRWLLIFLSVSKTAYHSPLPLSHSIEPSHVWPVSSFVAVGCWSILAYTQRYLHTNIIQGQGTMNVEMVFGIPCNVPRYLGPGRSGAHGDFVDCRPPCGIAGYILCRATSLIAHSSFLIVVCRGFNIIQLKWLLYYYIRYNEQWALRDKEWAVLERCLCVCMFPLLCGKAHSTGG